MSLPEDIPICKCPQKRFHGFSRLGNWRSVFLSLATSYDHTKSATFSKLQENFALIDAELLIVKRLAYFSKGHWSTFVNDVISHNSNQELYSKGFCNTNTRGRYKSLYILPFFTAAKSYSVVVILDPHNSSCAKIMTHSIWRVPNHTIFRNLLSLNTVYDQIGKFFTIIQGCKNKFLTFISVVKLKAKIIDSNIQSL